uniref:Uncharacterized protein n=1 Tax=Anguilla anguilla TaxID=7936 RepID=A0A0E9WQS7_ANGAN
MLTIECQRAILADWQFLGLIKQSEHLCLGFNLGKMTSEQGVLASGPTAA